ncbi:MAG: hypothetical protein BRC26_01650 [Nanohaloarchaea archaeon QH_8_44_6]|nr:MAG: hypothetical protein BRC26_01650 [Nanohaloarchaea archaeon QH_8_44_6]
MSYAYLLAGENIELAKAELEGFLTATDNPKDLEMKNRLAITDSEPSQLKRLALVHEVSEIIKKGNIDGFETDYRPENSFEVRAVSIGDEEHEVAEWQEEVGEELSNSDNSVDLERPDERIRIYLSDGEYVLGKLVEDIDRGLFDKRKNQERPFSSPISLDPSTARLLVNLSEVSAGEHILDPFCGTGGILIEAGLCGIGVHGLDIQEEMVKGAKENLEAYGIIKHDIQQGDVRETSKIFEQDFDAVVADLPYGKASKIENNPAEDFLDVVSELNNGKTVFMYNEPELNGFKPEFEIYIHKNLTRYIYVLD